MYAVNHVSQKAKGKISNYRVSRKQQFRSRGQITSKVSSEKNTINTQLTLMTSNSTRIKPMDIYKQEIEKKNRQVEFKRQAKELKQWEAPWDFVHTVAY